MLNQDESTYSARNWVPARWEEFFQTILKMAHLVLTKGTVKPNPTQLHCPTFCVASHKYIVESHIIRVNSK